MVKENRMGKGLAGLWVMAILLFGLVQLFVGQDQL